MYIIIQNFNRVAGRALNFEKVMIRLRFARKFTLEPGHHRREVDFSWASQTLPPNQCYYHTGDMLGKTKAKYKYNMIRAKYKYNMIRA